MKKKFKARVRHFTKDKYCVEYANYKFIPVWKTLDWWYGLRHPNEDACWSISLYSLIEAEQIANGLKSIEDVDKHYEPRIKTKEAWQKEENRWWKDNMPYTIKKIK